LRYPDYKPSSGIQAGAAGLLRGLESVLEVPGKTGVDARDFVQQHIVEIDLGREQSRRRTRAVQPLQVNMSRPDRAQGIANGAINGLAGGSRQCSSFLT